MPESETRFVKYIFVDIVGYSRDRSVEAQSDIIARLNQFMLQAVEGHVRQKGAIYLPTGDGVCAAIVDSSAPYDIHLQSALRLLRSIQSWNTSTKDYSRAFRVRVGLNQNIDNIITDINGNTNGAGAGINLAQRLMDLGDGGNILLSETVHETLQHRERYLGAFKRFETVVKHDRKVIVYQYVRDEPNSDLQINTPSQILHGTDPIDIELNDRISENSSTMGMVRGLSLATDRWKEAMADAISNLEIKLTEAETPLFQQSQEKWAKFMAKHLEFLHQYYSHFRGTMYRVSCAADVMDSYKARVKELRDLLNQLEERDLPPDELS